MEAMRQSWSDDRLDHLNYRVEEGFRQAHERSDRIETGVTELRAEVNQRFDRLEDRFDRLQQGLIVVGGGLIGTMIVAFGGVIATQI